MSSSNLPFHPMGPTITFTAVTGTPPAGQQAPIAPTTSTSAGQYRIINDSTVTVFLGVGPTSAAAIANAGAVATSVPLLPGTDEVLRFSPDAFFTGKSIIW
jgi:tartrate dehydratase beta subunit/fumarate hydratase class I family protein